MLWEEAKIMNARDELMSGFNPFYRAIEDVDRNQQAAVRSNILWAQSVDPDSYAKDSALAGTVGLPIDVVSRNRDEITRRQRIDEIDFDAMKADNPVLYEFLQDREFVGQAHDDVDNLGTIEKFLTRSKQGFVDGAQTNQLGRLGMQMASGLAQEDAPTQIKALQDDLQDAPQSGGFINDWVYPAAKILGQITDSAQTALPAGMALGATAAIAGQAGPQVAAPEEIITVPSAFAAGMAAGFASDAYTIEAGHMWLELGQIEQEGGQKFAPFVKEGASAFVGLLNATLEMVGLRAIGKPFHKAYKAAVSSAVINAVKSPVMRSAITNFGKNYAAGVATETGTEVLQEGVSILAGEVAKMASGDGFDTIFDDPKTATQAVERLISVAGEVARGMTLVGLPGPAASFSVDVVKARKAEKTFADITELKDTAARSKLRQRSPQQFQQFMKQAAQKSDVETVYVDGAALGELYQSGGFDEAFELLDKSEQAALNQELAAAQAHGGFVAVPLDTFISKIAGTEAFDALVGDVKFQEDDFTANEAARFNKDVQDIYETELNAAQKASDIDAEHTDAADRIGDAVREQSIRAGNTPEAALQHAVLHRARARVIQSYGLDPAPFWQGLEIRRELPENLQPQNVADLDALIERARSDIEKGGPAQAAQLEQARALAEELDRRGIDINEDNETIKAALKGTVEGGLEQPLNSGVNPDRRVDVLDLTALPDSPKTTFKDLLDELRIWVGEGIPTADADRIARILPRNVRHIAFSGAPIRHEDRKTRKRSIRNIVDLLGHAVLIESGPNTKPDKEKIGSYHRFYVPLWDGGKIRVVRVVMEQTKRGVKINPDTFDVYDVVVERKPPAAAGLSSDRATDPSPSKAAQRASSITIRQMLSGVKDIDGAAYFQPPQEPDPAQAALLEQADNRPRGSFVPAQGDLGPIINLFGGADLSTFLHESGHFFVDTMEKIAASADAPAQAKADFDALLKFVGAKQAADMDVRINADAARKKQEKLAQAFETYLSEGNAPSVELQSAFAKFRAWLLSVYRRIKGSLEDGGAELRIDEEVRKVFDRMLATDAEIAAAEHAATFGVQDTIADLMSDTERAAYAKADQDARAFATAELETAKAKEQARQAQRWWTDELEKIRAEIERDYAARPVYAALDVLRDRKAGVKLSREAIVDLRGKDALGLLPKGVYAKEGGVHPDDIAERVGMSSGDELLVALMSAAANKKERARLIMAQALTQMKSRHGDLQDNRSHAEKEAVKAVHNDRRGVFIEAELKALSRKVGAQPTPASVAKQAAARIIAKQPVKEATRLNRYYVASVKFARAAQVALAKQDFEGAAQAKRSQLLNHYLFSASRKARDEVGAMVKYFRKFDGSAKKLKSIDADYTQRIQELLSAYQFRISLRRHDKMAGFRAWLEEQSDQEEITAQVPEELLNVSAQTHYRNLTMEELQSLKDTIKHLEVLGRNKRKLLANKTHRDLAAAAEEIHSSILGNWKGEPTPMSASQTDAEKLKDKVLRRFSLRKIEFLLRELDGFKEGPAKRYIFTPIAQASNNLEERRHTSAQAVRELFSVYSGREARAMFSKKTFIPKIGDSYTKASILAVALNVGNADSRAKSLAAYNWNEEQLQAVLAHLDKRDWDFVQSVWDYIDTFWEETAALDKQTKGIAPPKIDAVAVKTPFGSYRGGYYPMKYDSRQSTASLRSDAQDMFKMMAQGQMGRPTTRQGRTKARVATVKGLKVRFDLDVLFEHIDETNHDLAMRKAALDVSRLLNHPTIAKAMRSTVGANRMTQLRDWLTDAVTGDIANQRTAADIFFGFVRRRTTVATMGYKLSTMLLQPLGYTQTTARFISDIGSVTGGMRYAVKGLTDFYGSPKEKTAFIYERSTMMRQRARTFDREVNDAIKRIKGGKFAIYQASLLAGIGKMQKLVDMPTWIAAYRFAQDKHAGNETAAVDYADSVVRMTQASGVAADLAAIQRGSEGQKLLTMYMTFFSAMHNMVVDEVKLTKAQGLKRAHIFATNMMLLTFIPANLFAMIFAAAGAGGPDDDEHWAGWLTKNWVTFGLAGIPFLKDVVSTVVEGFPYRMSPVQGALKAIPDFIDQAKQGELDKALLKTGIKTTALAVPLPANQLILTGEYLHDIFITGEKDPDNAVEALIEAFVQKDYQDR